MILVPEFDKLAIHLSPTASYIFQLGRDELDRFSIRLTGLSDEWEIEISKEDLFHILPSGSEWSHLLGWHSYFGIPFSKGLSNGLVIGLESVVPHARRGAYPVLMAYIFPTPLSEETILNLQKLADEIDPNYVGQDKLKFAKGIIRTKSTTPDEHFWVAGEVIRIAVDFYRKAIPFCFRTLVLYEGQLGTCNSVDRLLVTVPSTEEAFSGKNKLRLWLSKTYNLS
jgi:hypothetical protein